MIHVWFKILPMICPVSCCLEFFQLIFVTHEDIFLGFWPVLVPKQWLVDVSFADGIRALIPFCRGPIPNPKNALSRRKEHLLDEYIFCCCSIATFYSTNIYFEKTEINGKYRVQNKIRYLPLYPIFKKSEKKYFQQFLKLSFCVNVSKNLTVIYKESSSVNIMYLNDKLKSHNFYLILI